MKRGEIWWVNFDPSIGTEIRKMRPAVVVSNNAANAALNRIQVVPVTSNTAKLYPSEALIVVASKQGKAIADQLTTADKKRFGNLIGQITQDEMLMLERALKIQLGLPL